MGRVEEEEAGGGEKEEINSVIMTAGSARRAGMRNCGMADEWRESWSGEEGEDGEEEEVEVVEETPVITAT